MAAHDKNFDVIPIGHTFFFIWRIKVCYHCNCNFNVVDDI